MQDKPIIKIIETRENGSRRVLHLCDGESRTRESLKEETDINNIVARYQKTGSWSHVAKGLPWYGDVTQITDYRDAIDAVKRAEETFLNLPASVRKEFDNDPAKLIGFLQDSKNDEKAIELGLKVRLPEPPQKDDKPQTPPSP